MGYSEPGSRGLGRMDPKVLREVVRSYTYVGIWMCISIAVILFNKVRRRRRVGRSPAAGGSSQALLTCAAAACCWRAAAAAAAAGRQWLLAYSGFPFPIALTCWHMAFCSGVGFVAVRLLRLVKSHNLSAREYATRVMPIGARAAAAAGGVGRWAA